MASPMVMSGCLRLSMMAMTMHMNLPVMHTKTTIMMAM